MNQSNHNPNGFGQLISENYSKLTKSEKRIADYLNRDQNEAAFLTSLELAEKLHLSEATAIRFARSLGFNSYPAMREALQENFRHRMTHSARLRSRLDDLRSGDIFERVVVSEIDYLSEALQSVDRKAFDAAVRLLQSHRRIFVFGMGPSLSLVNLLEIRLTRSARQVIALNNSGQEMLEPMLQMNKNDLLIAIGFFTMTPSMKLVIEFAHERKTPVILVTDTLGPVVGEQADVILAARRGPVSSFHSLTVPMTIINSLLLSMTAADQDEILENLDKLDQIRERLKKISHEMS